MSKTKIVFLTGTRADYGKMKPLMKVCEIDENIELFIYVTGMHLFKQYGNTYQDILSDGYSHVHIADEYIMSSQMDIDLATTIVGFSKYVREINPDIIVVHGDRIEPLAGAIVGVLNNIKVAHIEGGEVTGTADEFMRHAISKLSSLHFVANNEARFRLIQLGENEKSIVVFGSPDVDIMLSKELPTSDKVAEKYKVLFKTYSIFIYHPVTTSDKLEQETVQVIEALKQSNKNYIVIYPNNDKGSEIICKYLDELKNDKRFLMFRSIPFEDFIVLLKQSEFIIGNSSAGVREACVFGIPAIDIGSRQNGRYNIKILRNIQHTRESKDEILDCISKVNNHRFISYYYGNGHSAEIFLKTINSNQIKSMKSQKTFVDSNETHASIMNYINEVSF